MIYLLNADRGAYDSVKSLVEAGRVQHLPCPTFPAFERHVNMLMDLVQFDVEGKVIPHDDHVIIDTLTRLADTTRGDMKIGVDMKGSWERKEAAYFKDKNYLIVYEAAGQLIMRHLRNLSNRGYRITVVCHEDEQEDKISGGEKRAPALNNALWTSLSGTATDIFRLTYLAEDQLGEDGSLLYPAGTRILQTSKDDVAYCKYSADTDLEGNFVKVPKYIPNPTMRRIERIFKKPPSFLVLFGEPGAGKTTLACSEAFTPKAKKEPVKA